MPAKTALQRLREIGLQETTRLGQQRATVTPETASELLELCGQAEAEAPTSPDPPLWKARTLRLCGRFDLALEQAREAVRRAPEGSAPLLELAAGVWRKARSQVSDELLGSLGCELVFSLAQDDPNFAHAAPVLRATEPMNSELRTEVGTLAGRALASMGSAPNSPDGAMARLISAWAAGEPGKARAASAEAGSSALWALESREILADALLRTGATADALAILRELAKTGPKGDCEDWIAIAVARDVLCGRPTDEGTRSSALGSEARGEGLLWRALVLLSEAAAAAALGESTEAHLASAVQLAKAAESSKDRPVHAKLILGIATVMPLLLADEIPDATKFQVQDAQWPAIRGALNAAAAIRLADRGSNPDSAAAAAADDLIPVAAKSRAARALLLALRARVAPVADLQSVVADLDAEILASKDEPGLLLSRATALRRLAPRGLGRSAHVAGPLLVRAASDLEVVLKLRPGWAPAIAERGRIRVNWAAGRTLDHLKAAPIALAAIDDLTQAVPLARRRSELLCRRGEARVAILMSARMGSRRVDSKLPADAERDFRDSLAADRRLADALTGLLASMTLRSLSGAPDTAKWEAGARERSQLADEAVSLSPSGVEAFWARIRVRRQLGTAAPQSNDADIQRDIAAALGTGVRRAETLWLASTVPSSTGPAGGDAYIGRVLESTLADLRKVAVEDPEFAEPWFFAGWRLVTAIGGRAPATKLESSITRTLKEALSAFSKAVELEPESSAYRLTRFNYILDWKETLVLSGVEPRALRVMAEADLELLRTAIADGSVSGPYLAERTAKMRRSFTDSSPAK